MWGEMVDGVDGSFARKDVQQIQSTRNAFCALLADGFVVTWGDPRSGAPL